MKKSRYTESQIIGVLKEVDAGMEIEEVCRQHVISSATNYNWKFKYRGMEGKRPLIPPSAKQSAMVVVAQCSALACTSLR